jgi:hypothetical protein
MFFLSLMLLVGPVQQPSRAILDVPYLTQTPELCGGAAVAMVLRYWGERQVFAEDFAPLVVPAERGIPANALVAAVRARGWQSTVIGSDAGILRSQIYNAIERGQPLIALIEVAPGTNHYVVIVAATDKDIVVHDPARAPFRVIPWESFDRAWAAAGRWMMLVLPPSATERVTRNADRGTRNEERETTNAASSLCDALVDRGVALALGDDKAEAEEALTGATRVCPSSAGAWRELAGWRFSQQRWKEARDFAQTALRLAPDDEHARELLATSRYLSGDVRGALDAWSRAGEPRIDLISVGGAERTHHPVIVHAAGLEPREVLTSEAFAHALRRIQALPVAAGAAMRYEPLAGGLAKVDMSIAERDPYPKEWKSLVVLGGRAAIGQEVKVDLAGLFGAGERISVAGRWQDERPRAAVRLMAPSPAWLPGIASFDAMWERQTYSTVRETRRRAGLQVADWVRSWMKWNAGISLDRFDSRRYVSIGGGAEVRLAGDRIALGASAAEWLASNGAEPFGTRSLLIAVRSTDDASRPSFSALSELNVASTSAPLAVWEGAGTGSGRPGLLRAHPLLDDRVLAGAVFGRRIARATIEYAHPVARIPAGSFALAAFVDAAQAWRRLSRDASPLFIDAGIGLRLRVPARGEMIRLDAAHGLRGGGARFSLGVIEGWPK